MSSFNTEQVSDDNWEPVSDDNWEPVSDEVADDSEVTLTHRKGIENDSCVLKSAVNSTANVVSPSQSDLMSFDEVTNSEEIRCGQKKKNGDYESNGSKRENDECSSGTDSHSNAESEESRKVNGTRRQSQLSSVVMSPGHRKSASSLDVSVPINLKSSPADPHLSDVNSISSARSIPQSKNTALDSVNSIISSTEKDSQPNSSIAVTEIPQQVAPASSFFDNVISSFSFKGSGPSSNSATKFQQEENNKVTNPPDIITHRRQTSINNKKSTDKKEIASSEIPQSPLREAEKPKEVFYKPLPSDNQPFDTKRFVDEKYLDTPFHYATTERDAEFHNLFNSVPKGDRLLDDFSCTLSREFLYQGRLYVSESNLCFHSSLLGWIAKVITPFKEVTYMEKTSTAGLFPNAISIETESGKTQFNGFISRDWAFTLIKEVWSRALLELGENGNLKPLPSESSIDHHSLLMDSGFSNKSFNSMTRPSEPPSRTSFISENDSIIEDAIRSVDDYTPSYSKHNSSVLTDEESEDDEDKNGQTVEDVAGRVKGYKLKANSKYEYDGPYYARETQVPFKPEDNKEYVLAEFQCNAPPGLVFQILFGGDDPSFWLEFFQSQDSSNFSNIGQFDKVNAEGQRYREFTYAKGLHFPVGPKSTKCVVEETILHLDYSDYINVVNTTRTPDVPSGGSFSTKTRYLFRWGSETTCILKISFYVEWTAGSWIKSMVESSCKSGQISATKDLVKQIQKYLEENTVETLVSIPTSPRKSQSRGKNSSKGSKLSQKRLPFDEPITVHEVSPMEARPLTFNNPNIVLSLLLFIIGLLVLNLLYQMSIKKEMNKIRSSTLFKIISPENKGFFNFAHSLADIPAKIKNETPREGSHSEFWDELQKKVLSNSQVRTDGNAQSDLLTREQLIAFIELLLLESSMG